MYVHPTRLQHLLTPAWYRDELHYRRELDCLFLPGWHFVGTLADIPRSGDFFTLELFGQPLQIRNFDGAPHAYLNVCAHRHCLMTHEPRGSSERIRCQYHGWEYDKDGHTGRIPEAKSFAPWDRENACLKKFRAATCGQLIFVSLATDGPTLQEFLGSGYDACQDLCSSSWVQLWAWETDLAANWKVVIENSLEAYHAECVHPKTFKVVPPEENCEHSFDASGTYLHYAVETPNWTARLYHRLQEAMLRRLGVTPTRKYVSRHYYPHLLVSGMQTTTVVQTTLPTSPSTCRTIIRLFGYRGTTQRWLSQLLVRWWAKLSRSVVEQIIREDMVIYNAVQRGLQVSEFPGVIGRLEERVYMFHQYILNRCAMEAGLAMDAAAETCCSGHAQCEEAP